MCVCLNLRVVTGGQKSCPSGGRLNHNFFGVKSKDTILKTNPYQLELLSQVISVTTATTGGSALFSRFTFQHRDCEILASFGYFVADFRTFWCFYRPKKCGMAPVRIKYNDFHRKKSKTNLRRPHHRLQQQQHRSLFYILPCVLLAVVVNIPKFFETETVT